MAPRPQEQTTAPHGGEAVRTAGNKVVISGMAGLYPRARYVRDLENILYNKVNPVTRDDLRWKSNHPEVGQYAGNVPDLEHFDAQFFKVHHKLGRVMDVMSRRLLEEAYEAIYDAGISPGHLAGQKVGVYIGTCFSETEKAWYYDPKSISGFGMPGCSKSMFANRISYWLNAKGPSMSIDLDSCSSTAALEAAYRAISTGECEAAIVGGANVCLHPQSSVHYKRIMKMSTDGKMKSFAEDADGCTKSEAINVLFLQKVKDAKRVYAEVVHVKCEFVSLMEGETGPMYGFNRKPEDTARLLKTLYEEAGVPPALVEYVEAFGAAIPEADKSELEAIDKVFCNGREEPLLVGSVMSNIGFGEAASGISAVTKVLIGFHNGMLAGNLHCSVPRRDVAALCEGRMRVLADNHGFRRTYAAVNSMSVTGVNAHVLLHGHYKPKDLNRYKASIPRLVIISGRQDSAVESAFEQLKSHPIDPEEIALLYNIHETNIVGHMGKGYAILDTNADGETYSLSQRAEYCDSGVQRPLWFVYSGMGSQWAGMGAQLMRIPIFAAAIERCRKVLEPKGIDIVHIITATDKTIFDNILHSFVGIAAIQIGLTDILLQLGLVPDKIIGHSVGELGCAYADGCLTAEEMILSAYSRGRVSLETPFVRGSMAAVGVGAQQMSTICPPEVEVACHNSADSCTISGPAEAMRSYVAELTSQGIFAKEVPCSNIAYHSRYIQEAGPGLLKYLKEVIKTPKLRTNRWVSSSVPQGRWDEPAAKYSSAEYHTNNLLSPVLFEEASALIPADAVLVEVAPHGLLQAILKRALPDSTINLPLTRRGKSDGVIMLLDAIGQLYMHGYNPKVQVLYPKVEFPVSTGTPYLSNYVEWAHQEKWLVPSYEEVHRIKAASSTFVASIHDTEYLQGHVIRNEMLLPFSYALMAAWDTLAMSLDVPKKSLSVEFRDVLLFTQPILHAQKAVSLSVSLHRGSGLFEVMDEDSKVATGIITSTDHVPSTDTSISKESSDSDELVAEDVYRVLYERGYAYSGAFRSIYSTNSSVSEATVHWSDNWVTFIDALIQLNTLKYTHSGVSQPDRIGRIVIDLGKHNTIIQNTPSIFDAQLSGVQNRTSCGGVIIEKMHFRDVLQNNDDQITLHSLRFVPRFYSKLDVSTSMYVLLQIAAENINKDRIKVVGHNLNPRSQIYEEMKKIAERGIPGKFIEFHQISAAMNKNSDAFSDIDVILAQKLTRNENISEKFHRILPRNTFIINEEDVDIENIQGFPLNFYKVVSTLKNTRTQLELARWRPIAASPMTSAFTVRTESDLALLRHARNGCTAQGGFLVVTSYPPVAGLISLVREWRRDSTRNHICVVMCNDIHRDNLYDELDIDLAYNVFNNETWGGEYYVPVEETAPVLDDMTLRSELVGDLDSLRWERAPELTGPGTLVAVHYAAINDSDVKQALGVLLQDDNKCSGYGMDFSGISKSGERVMGLVAHGAASSRVLAAPELTWPVPAHWSLEDAATVPFAYVFAYYCLDMKSASRITIKNGNKHSVLVHGGAGALGQAVISVALARGWRVFTTVGDAVKKRFLVSLFPALREEDIGSSRDACFGDMVLSATDGRGCDLVICCLKGDLKNVSLKCLAHSSTFLDVDQIISNENYSYGMYNLTNERSYIAVDIKDVIGDPKSKDAKRLHSLVSAGIASGEVRPLTRVVMAPHEAARAFRLLAASRHRGRALLRLATDTTPPQHRITESLPVHVIVCDTSSLGIRLADILIDDGIKNLKLHFNALDGHLQYKLRVWRKRGIQVTVTSEGFENGNNLADSLYDAVNSTSIEGVYVIAESSLQENVIRKIDLTTRAVCQSLKHFMVFSKDGSSGYNTCIQRTQRGLPATMLDLSILNKSQDAEGATWSRGATVALQRALRRSEPVLLALPAHAPRRSLLQHVAALAGLNISNETSSSTTLKELGMPIEKISPVCAYLRDIYKVSYDEKNIMSITLERLNQIHNKAIETQFKDLQGLEAIYTYVDPDELLATTDMVFLPTLTNNYTRRDDEFDLSETFLCIVPGLEGHYKRFRPLCERLKVPAFVLQPGLDRPDETPTQLARKYSEVLFKKTCLKNKFYILGYETGAVVALELAAILEEQGLTGTVFCLGVGPLESAAWLERLLRPLGDEDALQAALVRHMFTLMARGADVAAGACVERALHGCTSWTQSVDACVGALLGHLPHSAQYARALLNAAYARICVARKAAQAVQPRALRSRLVLLRASDASERAHAPCSLERYSRALHVEPLAAPTAHAAADLRASAIINSYLDDDTLTAFNNKNLCDSYLISADEFMKLK